MGSISNDIFCKILRASDKVYATNEVITQKLTLADPAGRLYDFNQKYYNSVLNSQVHLTTGTAYGLGNVMEIAGVSGIPRQYEFLYEFASPAPILASGGTIELHLEDTRLTAGFVDSGFSPHAQTIWITNGSADKWFELKAEISLSSATKAKITFTNTGGADYTGYINFSLTQTPVSQTT
tara:strand:- start:1695 stop:2234 length:540 start_codon:yes stop_codon:yes gene_type:complete